MIDGIPRLRNGHITKYRHLRMNRKNGIRLMAAFLAMITLYGVATLIVSYNPVVEALPDARDVAKREGFVTDGYFGDIVEQPGLFGDCTVMIGFTDDTKNPPQQIRITLVRRFTLGGWHVKQVTINLWTYEPIGSMPALPPRPPGRK